MRPLPNSTAKPILTVPEKLKLRFSTARQEPGYDRTFALQALETAKTYYAARKDGRAFSYSGGKTFLNSYPVNTPLGEGMIDCSTYIYLVLRAIPYESSPYAEQGLRNFDPAGLRASVDLPWGDEALATGKNGGVVRFAADLGRYYFEKGRCFTNRDWVKPGDLTFHCGTEKHSKRWMNVTHIGIVAEDCEHFYNVTSIPHKVVVLTRLSERSDLVFFARPDYGGMASEGLDSFANTEKSKN